MVEEGAGAGFHVFHVPLPVRAPEFAMPAGDYFGFEADGRDGGVGVGVGGRVAFALAVAAHAHDVVGLLQGAGDGGEVEGGAGCAGFDVRDESYGWEGVFTVGVVRAGG